MTLNTAQIEQLIRRLDEDRDAYLQRMNDTHDALLQLLTAAARNNAISAAGDTTSVASRLLIDAGRAPATTPSTPLIDSARAPTSERASITRDGESSSQYKSSMFTGDDAFDEGESLYVQEPLQPEIYNEDGLREHMRKYAWPEAAQRVIDDALRPEVLYKETTVFPNHAEEQAQLAPGGRGKLPHYSIFDVGADGSPLEIKTIEEGSPSRSESIWNRIQHTNADPKRERKAVGRITIVREPTPLLLAALHYTMSKHFDMDELYGFLDDDHPVLYHPHRAFDNDERHRRSFSMTFEYFTVIGENCQPMPYQRHDAGGEAETHIPISRCGSVIALSLEGKPMSKIRNKDRKINKKWGEVYDPFSPWRVVNVQCYPDWISSTDSHDSTKHYVNGPEAFLVTLRAELKDAVRRLKQVHKDISELVEPPGDFIFNLDIRDTLLFEDKDFTFSRRYFWASQTLGIMNQDIRDMVDSYRDCFKDKVWDGEDKILWPGKADGSAKLAHWRKRMASLRKDLDEEIAKLEQVERWNEKKMQMIKGLHDNLFSGTSVFESRKSVEQAAITVIQGRNIKLLTLVTIFFLPLTFVTSVYGMTNMPPSIGFQHFAWTTLAICIPTYILIGTLNTDAGLKWWSRWTTKTTHNMGRGTAKAFNAIGYSPQWTAHYRHKQPKQKNDPTRPMRRRRNEDATMQHRDTYGGMPVLSPHGTYTAPGSTTSPGARSPTAAVFKETDFQSLASTSKFLADRPTDHMQRNGTSDSLSGLRFPPPPASARRQGTIIEKISDNESLPSNDGVGSQPDTPRTADTHEQHRGLISRLFGKMSVSYEGKAEPKAEV